MIKNAGISGALMQKESPQQVSTQFVNVESLEDYIDRAKQLGARVVKDKQETIMLYWKIRRKMQLEYGRTNKIITNKCEFSLVLFTNYYNLHPLNTLNFSSKIHNSEDVNPETTSCFHQCVTCGMIYNCSKNCRANCEMPFYN
jgi:hypothetical protein